MNNNAWFKKENPFQTVIGYGGGATGFGAYSSSVVSTKYVDEVFSTYLWEGDGSSSRTITTNIDTSTDGGLIWIKNRSSGTYWNVLFDSVRGGSQLSSNNTDAALAQASNVAGYVSNYSTTGFTLTAGSSTNDTGNRNGDDNVAWTFRKQKGFFDVVTYTGNGSNRTIAHNLGSVPGCIMIKRLDTAENWRVYHRSIGPDKILYLNLTSGEYTSTNSWNSTTPTSTVFSLGTHDAVNDNGATYVAYLFAGGASTAATARSVDFDGATNGDALSVADFPNFRLNDFTVECWFYPHTISGGIDTIMDNYQNSSSTGAWFSLHQNDSGFYWGRNNGNPIDIQNVLDTPNKWYHVAMVRNGTDHAMYLNGTKIAGFTETYDYTDGGAETRTLSIGRQHNSSFPSRQFNGLISNARIVIGTAVYTSSFRPPIEPLTNITNTTILCCNNSSVTGSTVTPGTITTVSSPTASSDSPFDDPEGFKFGENEDQSIIKTGKYFGNGSTDGPEVYVGFEPQWLLIKGAGGGDWNIVDNMRGIVTGGDDNRLWANLTTAESTSLDVVDFTPTGFKITHDGGSFNAECIYIAIRRPDGYVGKPPSAGTGAFTMDTGNASTTIPVWDSNFVVDFAMNRAPASTTSWYTSARLIQDYYLLTNGTNGRNQDNGAFFDSNVGWAKDGYGTWDSTYQSWMWKRGQGMDVVTYTGNGSNVDGATSINHNLAQTPEMIWIHPLYGGTYSGVTHWTCSHKGLNEGTDPWQYTISLNNTWAEAATSNFGNTAPTSTHFYVGDPGNGRSNDNGTVYMAMLFASANDADGNPISKVGSYEGSNSPITITTGFQPRFFFVKRYDQVGNWTVFDTLRGWGSGDDCKMEFNTNGAQNCNTDFGYPTSTGIYLTNDGDTNLSGYKFIYYAHA